MRDLKRPLWMYLKAAGFCVISALSAGILVVRMADIWTVALVLLLAWSAARFYYFCFYVIERYIDPQYRFAGVFSAIRHVIRSGRY